MAKIPQAVLDKCPELPGLKLRGRGKVRDSYYLDHNGGPDDSPKMLVLASDRCSIFDFVLNTIIPEKGEVLTALNYFWINRVIRGLCETDFLAGGKEIDGYLPRDLEDFQENPDLQKRATVVRLLPAPEIEDIVRFVLTGSGWKSYQENQTICGHLLPAGLTNGSLLPYPLYTPTTKAQEGHDVHMNADEAVAKYGAKRERLALQVAGLLANYSASRGIRMADTKFEFSGDVLVDEKGTPDSSRFVDEIAWQKAVKMGKFPPSLDKQYVRNWGISQGIDKLDPENPDHVAQVHSLVVPDYEVKMTTLIYRYIFWRLTGMKLERFQREEMGIAVDKKKLTVEIVIGSESDRPQIEDGLRFLGAGRMIKFRVSVLSCHRNPSDVRSFAETCEANVVTAGAGEAAALPGIIKSWLCHFGKSHIPVIGVAFKGKDEKADMAARLSIENLPGQPVELNVSGKAYFGQRGFTEACVDSVDCEFLPKTMEAKPVKIGEWAIVH